MFFKILIYGTQFILGVLSVLLIHFEAVVRGGNKLGTRSSWEELSSMCVILP